jgi:hypothetical protein
MPGPHEVQVERTIVFLGLALSFTGSKTAAGSRGPDVSGPYGAIVVPGSV